MGVGKLRWQACLRETHHPNIVELKTFSLIVVCFVRSACSPGSHLVCLNQNAACKWRSLLQAMWTFT